MENCFRGLDCCCSQPPFNPELRVCVDACDNTPRVFKQICRDCFWPIFTHPRWLPCDVLYGCCREHHEHHDC